MLTRLYQLIFFSLLFLQLVTVLVLISINLTQKNDTHKSYETCILFNNKSIMYNVKVNYGQVFWFFSKQYQIKSVIIDVSLNNKRMNLQID